MEDASDGQDKVVVVEVDGRYEHTHTRSANELDMENSNQGLSSQQAMSCRIAMRTRPLLPLVVVVIDDDGASIREFCRERENRPVSARRARLRDSSDSNLVAVN